MYKKEIVTHEYVYSEQEQERLEEIRDILDSMVSSGLLDASKMSGLISEMNDILNNEWSPPMPF